MTANLDPGFTLLATDVPALLGAAETSLTVPTTTSTLFTAGANGAKIEEIVIDATATTVAGLVYVFRYDGTTYHKYDTIPVVAFTASSSAAPFHLARAYPNLYLPTSAWSLRVSQSIAGNASILKAHCVPGNF